MIKLSLSISLLFMIYFLNGCGIHINQLNPVGTLNNVEPKSKNIYVCISKDILDNFRVKTVGSLPMNVKHYRESLKAGFSNTFKPFFKDVIFVDEIPNNGTSIMLTRADIKHVMAKFDDDGNPVTATCRVKYNTILYNEGNAISNSSGEVTSEEISSNLSGLSQIAEDALGIMLEQVGNKFFGIKSEI